MTNPKLKERKDELQKFKTWVILQTQEKNDENSFRVVYNVIWEIT